MAQQQYPIAFYYEALLYDTVTCLCPHNHLLETITTTSDIRDLVDQFAS